MRRPSLVGYIKKTKGEKQARKETIKEEESRIALDLSSLQRTEKPRVTREFGIKYGTEKHGPANSPHTTIKPFFPRELLPV